MNSAHRAGFGSDPNWSRAAQKLLATSGQRIGARGAVCGEVLRNVLRRVRRRNHCDAALSAQRNGSASVAPVSLASRLMRPIGICAPEPSELYAMMRMPRDCE